MAGLSDSMVDRVGAAIWAAMPGTKDELARAAILAMREPTEAMLDAGHETHVRGVKQFNSIVYAANYTAMIDAALKDT